MKRRSFIGDFLEIRAILNGRLPVCGELAGRPSHVGTATICTQAWHLATIATVSRRKPEIDSRDKYKILRIENLNHLRFETHSDTVPCSRLESAHLYDRNDVISVAVSSYGTPKATVDHLRD